MTHQQAPDRPVTVCAEESREPSRRPLPPTGDVGPAPFHAEVIALPRRPIAAQPRYVKGAPGRRVFRRRYTSGLQCAYAWMISERSSGSLHCRTINSPMTQATKASPARRAMTLVNVERREIPYSPTAGSRWRWWQKVCRSGEVSGASSSAARRCRSGLCTGGGLCLGVQAMPEAESGS
jgi:hypothetical protein